MSKNSPQVSSNYILLDCNFLVAWTSKKTSKDDRLKMDHLLDSAGKNKQKLVIPTPVIAEYLVKADAAGLEWLDTLEKKASIIVVPFDRIAAFECAQIDRAALGAGDKKDGVDASWQKIKIDRQIVAIGKAVGCKTLITSDLDLKKAALRSGISVLSIQDLEFPHSAMQGNLDLKKPKQRKKT